MCGGAVPLGVVLGPGAGAVKNIRLCGCDQKNIGACGCRCRCCSKSWKGCRCGRGCGCGSNTEPTTGCWCGAVAGHQTRWFRMWIGSGKYHPSFHNVFRFEIRKVYSFAEYLDNYGNLYFLLPIFS